jgi:hypothetical protein
MTKTQMTPENAETVRLLGIDLLECIPRHLGGRPDPLLLTLALSSVIGTISISMDEPLAFLRKISALSHATSVLIQKLGDDDDKGD